MREEFAINMFSSYIIIKTEYLQRSWLAMLYRPPFGCGCESATRILAILSSRQNFFPAKSSHGSFNVDICNNQSIPLRLYNAQLYSTMLMIRHTIQS